MSEQDQKENKIVHTIELVGTKPELMSSEGEYKGCPMLNIVFIGGGYPMTLKFGVAKAKMILHSLPEIKSFYDKHHGRLDAKDSK